MGEHDHEHQLRQTKFGEVDPEQSLRLAAEARENIGTNVGWALQKASEAQTQSEVEFWLAKVDGFRYMAQRQIARAKLDATAIRNLQADERLAGTEASLQVDTISGDACVLAYVRGPKAPPGGYTLIRRVAGETATEGYGQPPYGNKWVPRGLRMGVVHEFAVASWDSDTAKCVQGPWLSVAIGNVSDEAIQAAEQERYRQLYMEREARHAREAQEHSDAAAQRRQDQAEALREQQEAADAMNARRDREWQEKQAAHEKAVSELSLVAPREMEIRLRDLKGAGMVADISFLRGTKAPNIYQFKVNGTVLGYYPDGRHSGRKPENHRYERTVNVPRGQNVEIHVYGVTDHGDGGDEIILHVPQSLEQDRPEKIEQATRTFVGRRTRSGKPYVKVLRRHSKMPDISVEERNTAHAAVSS